jgi:hypothetical protein
MRVPLEWLREYVSIGTDAEKLARDLTMLGTKIEAVHAPATEWSGVFIGKVLDARQHPNADRLRLCRVDVGGENGHRVRRANAPVSRSPWRASGPAAGRARDSPKIKIRGEASERSARRAARSGRVRGILELDDTREAHSFKPAPIRCSKPITPNQPDDGVCSVWRAVALCRACVAHHLAQPTGRPRRRCAWRRSPTTAGAMSGAVRNVVELHRLVAPGLAAIGRVDQQRRRRHQLVLFETGSRARFRRKLRPRRRAPRPRGGRCARSTVSIAAWIGHPGVADDTGSGAGG